MEQKPLPTIVCNSCNLSQPYRKQAECIHCQRRLQHWSVQSQLKIWENKQKEKKT